ncbi:MAG: branched-chain amino acid ABC transporter permease [Halobaculum sp.]
MTAFGQYLVNGLVFSSIVVLGSTGLSVIYDIAGFANFAHGDTMTVGAYAAFAVVGVVGLGGPTVAGLPATVFLAVAVGAATAAVVAVITHRLLYEWMETDAIGLLITSIGVAFVYRGLVRGVFGETFRSYGVEQSGPIPVISRSLGVAVTERGLVMVVGAVLLIVGLHVLLQYTTLGRKMRAMADNPGLARASGIRTERITLATWVIGAGLAGTAGVFLGLFNQLTPRMGFSLLLLVFAAVILGGIGSAYGAMLGGLLIGLVEQLPPVLRSVGVPVDDEYSAALVFLVMVVVLLVRPRGIAGEVSA